MEREIKLVALDLDGTTFNSEKVITERTREAIAAAIKKGVIVMPATGRQKTGLPESFTSIPGVRYALTSNGGAVVDLWEDSIIYADFIPYKTACRIIDHLIQIDALIEFYHDGKSYADRKSYNRALHVYKNFPDWFKEYIKVSRIPVDDLRERVYSGKFNIEKMLASFDDMILRQQLFDEMHNDPELSVVFGNSFNVEITAATANKGHSLLKLAGKLEIMPEQIMVCGDTMNDRTMFEAAGLAVAMGNADEEIKAMADDVTLSNDEDGVAAAIEKWVL